MIYSTTITKPEDTGVKWLSKVPALATPNKTFEFKPGLNILWGKNGCGKTTLLHLMGRLFHCEQGGMPVITEGSLREIMGGAMDRKNPYKAVEIKHNGQGVCYFDPSHAVGLSGGSFDWDFGMEGITNVMAKGSAGETTLRRLSSVLKNVTDRKAPAIQNKFGDRANEVWQKYLDSSKNFLKGTEPKGQPTVLFDEPERSFDLPTQTAIWRWIRSYAQENQFIVASHCMFALNISEANYIELEPGYLETSRRCLQVLTNWEKEPLIPIPTGEEAAKSKKEKKAT